MSPHDEPMTDPQAPAFDEPRTAPEVPVAQRRIAALPWGLLMAWAVYALLVLGYVWATYWRSADYQAAVHYRAAHEVLGPSEGRHSTREELTEAYRHLLEAARLKPEVRTFHDELESLNWRFDERHWRVPEHLRHSAEAVAMTWTNIQKQNAPILVVGLRDRGWAPDQLLEGPSRVLRWAPLGAILIAAVWAFGRFNAKRQREEEKEKELRALEDELASIDRHRARVASTARRPRPRSS